VSAKLRAEQWRELVFSAELSNPNTALDADYDGDGVKNLLSFALNGDPRVPFSAKPPELVVDVIDGKSYIGLKVTRNPVADVQWIVERSPTLGEGSWTTEGITTVTDTPELLLRRYTVALEDMGTNRMFLRLVVRPLP
jgi:hypothetical protein